MAGIPGIPTNFQVQTGNQQNLVSWSQSPGATSYVIQRSLDNVTYSSLVTLSGSPLASSYVDSAITLGTQYWYKTAAGGSQINCTFASSTIITVSSTVGLYPGTALGGPNIPPNTVISSITNATQFVVNNPITVTGSGYFYLISPFTNPQSIIPAASGEMSLAAIRLAAKQRADRVNSNFVTDPEWNQYINQAMYELYDLLITVYEDYYIAIPVSFVADGVTYLYPLPNGSNTFTNNLTGATFTPPALYKLMGVDLALQNATNAFVTINKFNFIDRNRFVFPNTASTIYGVFNLQYRLMGSNIEFIPTPSAGQNIRLWYIPRLTNLLQDTDTTVTGISGWVEYIIVKAAYYALTKEESDTQSLVMQLEQLNERIVSSASNRDAGQPDKISDTRASSGGYGTNGNGSGFNGGIGGY